MSMVTHRTRTLHTAVTILAETLHGACCRSPGVGLARPVVRNYIYIVFVSLQGGGGGGGGGREGGGRREVA